MKRRLKDCSSHNAPTLKKQKGIPIWSGLWSAQEVRYMSLSMNWSTTGRINQCKGHLVWEATTSFLLPKRDSVEHKFFWEWSCHDFSKQTGWDRAVRSATVQFEMPPAHISNQISAAHFTVILVFDVYNQNLATLRTSWWDLQIWLEGQQFLDWISIRRWLDLRGHQNPGSNTGFSSCNHQNLTESAVQNNSCSDHSPSAGFVVQFRVCFDH